MKQENHSKGIMHGKRGIVMGVANDRSIAWGIADAIAKQGAEIAFTYQGEALQKELLHLLNQLVLILLYHVMFQAMKRLTKHSICSKKNGIV